MTLVTVKEGEAYQADFDPRVTRYVLGSCNLITLIWRLVRLLRNETPDVLVNFLFHATLLGRIAALLSRVPCVSSYRNISYGNARRDALVRIGVWLDSSTLSNVAGAQGRLFPMRTRRELLIIPNMYLGKSIKPSKQNASGDKSRELASAFHWCFLGRLQPQKNLSTLLHAFKQLSTENTLQMRLSIAGDGRETKILQAKVEELGLADSVILLGHVAEPEKLLHEADALILPSRWEGMPNVLMEAMATGTPCVATPVGAVPEMLGSGTRGVVAKNTTADAIAQAMAQLLSMSPAERRAMVERAQRYITETCDIDTVVDQWEAHLQHAARI